MGLIGVTYIHISAHNRCGEGVGRLAPKVIFLRKSQVKSPKSQVMFYI
jgi:hypothetical protein